MGATFTNGAIVVRETLQQGQVTPADEMEVAPVLEPMAQSLRGATSIYRVNKGMTIPQWSLQKQVITRQMLFSDNILKEDLSPQFRPPHVNEYSGTIDPEEHLGYFKNSTILHQYPEGVKG